MKVKYFGSYYGPNYGGYTCLNESYDAFGTLERAKAAMRNRQKGDDWVTEYHENEDNYLVPWCTDKYRLFFDTTEQDYMYLHQAVREGDGTWVAGDLVYRLSIGERGGIIVEQV